MKSPTKSSCLQQNLHVSMQRFHIQCFATTTQNSPFVKIFSNQKSTRDASGALQFKKKICVILCNYIQIQRLKGWQCKNKEDYKLWST